MLTVSLKSFLGFSLHFVIWIQRSQSSAEGSFQVNLYFAQGTGLLNGKQGSRGEFGGKH